MVESVSSSGLVPIRQPFADCPEAGLVQDRMRIGVRLYVRHAEIAYIDRMSELLITGQLSSLVTSLGAVFLLTAFMFRSWIAGLVNVIPISLVIVVSFGLLGLPDIPLEIGKSLTAPMVIGIGIDYTIHFLNKYRLKVRDGLTDPEAITVATMVTSGKAIFFNGIVVIGGFSVLLTSHFLINFYLGAMLALNIGACLLASMTVLPAILNMFKPRFVYGEEKPACVASRHTGQNA